MASPSGFVAAEVAHLSPLTPAKPFLLSCFFSFVVLFFPHHARGPQEPRAKTSLSPLFWGGEKDAPSLRRSSPLNRPLRACQAPADGLPAGPR